MQNGEYTYEAGLLIRRHLEVEEKLGFTVCVPILVFALDRRFLVQAAQSAQDVRLPMIVGPKKNRHSSIKSYFDLSPNRQEILDYQALKDHAGFVWGLR